eukprot:Nk52_evm27s296 gene=Nk52_evmTU27s296
MSSSVAFDVDVKLKVSPSKLPMTPVRKRLEERRLSAVKNTPTLEQVREKLGQAEQQQKKLEQARREKAQSVVTRSNEVNRRQKLENEKKALELDSTLKQLMSSAENVRQKRIESSVNKLREHIQQVELRRQAASETCLTPGKKDIEDKLESASKRKEMILTEKKERAKKEAEKAKEIAEKQKMVVKSRTESKSETLKSEMKAAEESRMNLLNKTVEKLSAHSETVENRKKKASEPNTPQKMRLEAKLQAAAARKIEREQERVLKAQKDTKRVEEISYKLKMEAIECSAKLRQALDQNIASATHFREQKEQELKSKLSAHSERVEKLCREKKTKADLSTSA